MPMRTADTRRIMLGLAKGYEKVAELAEERKQDLRRSQKMSYGSGGLTCESRLITERDAKRKAG